MMAQFAGILSSERCKRIPADIIDDASVNRLYDVWLTLMQSRAWLSNDWNILWDDITERYSSNSINVNAVTDMIATFIPRRSAEALTHVLTTNSNITQQQRDEMVALYEEYKLLSCFDDETLVPMANSSVVATGREGCKTRFKCLAMQCLPMTFTGEQVRQIEDQLSTTRTHLVQGNIVRVMMEGCGVRVDNTSSAEVTSRTSRSDDEKVDILDDQVILPSPPENYKQANLSRQLSKKSIWVS